MATVGEAPRGSFKSGGNALRTAGMALSAAVVGTRALWGAVRAAAVCVCGALNVCVCVLIVVNFPCLPGYIMVLAVRRKVVVRKEKNSLPSMSVVDGLSLLGFVGTSWVCLSDMSFSLGIRCCMAILSSRECVNERSRNTAE